MMRSRKIAAAPWLSFQSQIKDSVADDSGPYGISRNSEYHMTKPYE
jgi:hypothetical protein